MLVRKPFGCNVLTFRLHTALVLIHRSGNQAARLLLPGLQHDVRRKLIRIVFLAPENRYF
jgi:hypothetical protein